jgi:hypothetical protein
MLSVQAMGTQNHWIPSDRVYMLAAIFHHPLSYYLQYNNYIWPIPCNKVTVFISYHKVAAALYYWASTPI